MATTIFNKPIDTEVNDLKTGKMDKPTNAGTADQVLRNDGNGGSEWGDNPSASEIGTAVTSWLDTNVPTGTTVAIDRSLTVDGAAANSQTVGKVKSAITKKTRNLVDAGTKTFEEKYIYSMEAGLPAGEYTISFNVTTTDTDSDYVRVNFYKTRDSSQMTNSRKVGEIVQLKSTERIKATFTASDQILGIIFYAGSTSAGSTGDTATYKDIQIEEGDTATPFIPYITAEDYEQREIRKTTDGSIYDEFDYITRNTKGHVRHAMAVDVMPMDIYKDNSGSIKKCKTVMGSEYIQVKQGEILNICSALFTTISDSIYLYFYDKDRKIIWDYLNTTDASTGEKNRITLEQLRAANGLQFSNFSADTYVRFSHGNASENGIHVLIWDGKRSGYAVTADARGFVSGVETVLPGTNKAAIQLQPSAKFIMAKPGYTLTDLYTVYGEDATAVSNTGRLPAQCVCLDNIPSDSKNKNIHVVKNYNYSTGEYDDELITGDLSDAIMIIDAVEYSCESVAGFSKNYIQKRINNLMDFSWEAKADIADASGNAGEEFKEGTKYRGIPYRTGWLTPHFVGWHVSKHTFINAANDKNSVFYNHSEANSGPYYSLVCSAFGTLVCAFQKPNSNFGFMRDPTCYIEKDAKPTVGSLMTNSVGHCLVPVSLFESFEAEDNWIVKVAEAIVPLTAIRNVIGGINTFNKVIGPESIYLNNYEYTISNKERRQGYTPYDITTATVTNGSARPDRGDRSVYTSGMDVEINIKDANANRLYYQKFNVTMGVNGVPTQFTANGDPAYIEFEAGTEQVTLRSATSGGSYTGANLEDGAIYGVWASDGTAQITAPDNTEYLEWHDISSTSITYNIENGVFYSDSDFWYVVANAKNYKDHYDASFKQGLITILHNDAVNTDGSAAEHHDYSSYSQQAYITSVLAFFIKGSFGAYVAPVEEATIDGTIND